MHAPSQGALGGVCHLAGGHYTASCHFFATENCRWSLFLHFDRCSIRCMLIRQGAPLPSNSRASGSAPPRASEQSGKNFKDFNDIHLKANARCFPLSRSHLFSLTLTLSLSHPLSHTLSISPTLSHSLSLSLFHSLTHSLSHSLTLSLSHSLSKCPPHGCHVHASSLDGHRRGRLVCGGARVPRA